MQGREVAHNIARPKDLVAYTKVPIFWSSVGKGLRYLGTGAGFDETYTDGDLDELKASRLLPVWARLTNDPDSSYRTRRKKARSPQ